MKTLEFLERLVLDKTGAFLFVRPTDEDIRDINNLLKSNISRVRNGFSYPFLRECKKVDVQVEDEHLSYIELPEGSLVDIALKHPAKPSISIMNDPDADLSILGTKLYFDRKPADSVYVTYIPYTEITDEYKLHDSLVDCVVNFTYADWLDQQQKPQEAQVARAIATRQEEQAIHQATITFNEKLILR